MDEQMVSKAPGSGADCEQSVCSTDLRKHHPRDHCQTDTAGRKMEQKNTICECCHIATDESEGRACIFCAFRTYFLYAQKYIV